MTAMPELVAGFHSLVGLAAVFVAISAFLNPEIFNLGYPGDIKIASLEKKVAEKKAKKIAKKKATESTASVNN